MCFFDQNLKINGFLYRKMIKMNESNEVLVNLYEIFWHQNYHFIGLVTMSIFSLCYNLVFILSSTDALEQIGMGDGPNLDHCLPSINSKEVVK